jgi:transketolase
MPAHDDNVTHDEMANAIRALAMDAVEKAKSGHPGLPMGAADIATVLFTNVRKYDAAAASWADRDRFVLSAGRGSMLLYALRRTKHDHRGTATLPSRTPGHPEYRHAPGVEATAGPLGQGLALAAGMALAERMLNAEFGPLVDHHTYVLASDGDLMEGISQDAIIGEAGIFIGMTGFGASAPTRMFTIISTLRQKPSPRLRCGVATVDAC